MKYLRTHSKRIGERLGSDRHDHVLLEVDRVGGVRSPVENVHHRHGQHTRERTAEIAV